MHAGAGTILFYHDLARRLGPDQPIYGLQAQGLYGKATPHATVEEMAAHYIQEIRTVQPEGPYQLAGFCFGATLAFEMAQQLRAAGFEVGLLASFDGGRPGYRYRSLSSRRLSLPYPKSRRQWFLYHLAHVRLFGPGYVPQKIADRWIGLWRANCYRFGRRRAERGRSLPTIVRRSFFLHNHALAEYAYRPRPYPGKMVLFKTKGLFVDPNLGWDELVTGGVDIHEIPGKHRAHRDLMSGEFVIALADRLNKYLAERTPGPLKARETGTVPGRLGGTSGGVETTIDPDSTRAPQERPRAPEEALRRTRVPA
jgi:thioesterase domain-containing protein